MLERLESAKDNMKEFSDLGKMSLHELIAGRFLTREYLAGQVKLGLLILALLFCYVGNRFACDRKTVEIDRLEKQLEDLKLDALTRTSDLMLISRQSQVKRMIKSHGVDLTESTTPPFRIN